MEPTPNLPVVIYGLVGAAAWILSVVIVARVAYEAGHRDRIAERSAARRVRG